MNRVAFLLALVLGSALAGCVAENSYIDTEAGMTEMKTQADSQVEKPWVGADQGRFVNDKGF